MDEQLFRLRFQMGTGQMEGLKKARALKKDRARVLTILRERAGPAAGAGEKN
jgi:large subunit ribosomal protein L29